MNDMSAVIVAKSDQWNADDFAAGPRTFTVEDVQIRPGTEQPVQIRLAGSDKVFRPCKTVSRILVAGWGADANAYRGRSLTLYTDPGVTWGGMKVGGIRVSHMSDLDKPLVIALQEKKGSRKMTTVQQLKADAPAGKQTAEQWVDAHLIAVNASADTGELDALIAIGKKAVDKLLANSPALGQKVLDAYTARQDALDDHQEKRADEDYGETFTEEADRG